MNVSDLQRKLSTWAEQDEERKFHGLYKLITDVDWINTAYAHVKRNRGSRTAGMDGVDIGVFDRNREANLTKLREDLKAGTFEPSPVRGVTLHETKPDGRVKTRPLGISTLRDRIVQEALRMILEPIYEADFSAYSFGFRPNRCTMDAVAYLAHRIKPGPGRYYWVIEGDISSYFTTINHRKLLRLLRRRIKDEQLLDLSWRFLRAGIMEGKLFRDTNLGVPQGGIVSPLLANVYLHELDRYMEGYTNLTTYRRYKRRQAGLSNFLYVRYADDFVILCDGTKQQAEAMREELYQFLKTVLKLELSKEKTRVTHANDGFRFLGFWLQRCKGSSGKMACKILIPDEAKKKLIDKVKRILAPSTHHLSLNVKIMELNRVIGGWGRYYQYSSSPKNTFGTLDYVIWHAMAHWLGRKYKRSKAKVARKFYSKQWKAFATNSHHLMLLRNLPVRRYRIKTIPNPYTTEQPIQREELFSLDGIAPWGEGTRKGQADFRDLILERDGQKCAKCGQVFPKWELELDHIKPVRRFKRPSDANYLENFQMLCTADHREKTKQDNRC